MSMSTVHRVSVGLFLAAVSTTETTRYVCVGVAMLLSVVIAYRLICWEIDGR